MILKTTKILSIALMCSVTFSNVYAEDDMFVIPEENIEIVSANEAVEAVEAVDENGEAKKEEVSDEVAINELDDMLNEEIEKEDMVVPQVANGFGEEEAAEGFGQEIVAPKLKFKNYKNVKYDKNFLWYSVIPHNKKAFTDVMTKQNISNSMAKEMYGYARNATDIILNALLLDYVYKKPHLAENYYLKFRGNPKITFYYSKILLADYLLRTGRPSAIQRVIKNSDCMSHYKYMSICNYYLGISDYLKTGNNKNVNLRLAQSRYKKAGLIYNKR